MIQHRDGLQLFRDEVDPIVGTRFDPLVFQRHVAGEQIELPGFDQNGAIRMENLEFSGKRQIEPIESFSG